MTPAEQLIANAKGSYIGQALSAWRGREHEFIIEIVRGLDEVAFAFTMAPNRAELIEHDVVRHHILRGATVALRPFLERLGGYDGDVPWVGTSPRLSGLADQYLENCGRFAVIERIAAFERYGLAKSSLVGKGRLLLDVQAHRDDTDERRAGVWLGTSQRENLAAVESKLAAMKDQIARKIDRHASVHDGWSIKFDPLPELSEYHRDYATIFSASIAEADALPGTSIVAGRSFSDWNGVSLTALGRALYQIACATRLKATTGTLTLRNVLTGLARKDDIISVWKQAGETDPGAHAILEALSFNAGTARLMEAEFELPVPYYIGLGKRYVLLPVFGALLNPHAGLVWHLKRNFRPDWDNAVNGREDAFRRELPKVFVSPRYVVSARGACLRRPDGSNLTDVDAVVLDTSSGRLILVQLKWPDVYGRSLAERNSKRVNLLKANDWVNRVSGWIGGRTSSGIAPALGLTAAGEIPPAILVIARHVARFSGEGQYDLRAKWASWPGLVRALSAQPDGDVIELAGSLQRPAQPGCKEASVYHLPGLTVEVRA